MVRVEKQPSLCRSDEIGEIVLCTKPGRGRDEEEEDTTESLYYGLKGLTEKVFKCHPVDESDHDHEEENDYVRTGLLGYVNPVSNVPFPPLNLLFFLPYNFLFGRTNRHFSLWGN